ncbi:MAG TPA: helix-turn-helix domain-containing protein [Thermomicrobiales bacterium]|jgi:DNA-binding HxlR family transcriptional regulator|nr:MarR family transcriptional regulator [Chloroflexota bacterium]HQX63739.1 helix-turn-helix domain-containing protein [Thermomicrobiales bacterium]HBY47546.1 MarR family transcriptional regulator [Chloroflexota bacterium]HCG29491.1 MarR family transcriptional regulator [Chloroflexota bacterium]HQZ89441.1 helix-turn-helix domain-containing protein [Thermomicrobiales bacterium]
MSCNGNNTPSPFCPKFHHAVELIGRRWTGAILRTLLSGETRYSDITAAIPGLSDRLLSERLRELEAEGIVIRTVIPEMPVRIEYHLTEKGQSLLPVIEAVSDWAETWVDGSVAVAACRSKSASPATSATLEAPTR